MKALARAHRWQRLVESGRYGSVRELAAAEQVDRASVARVLRLTLLAPDIAEAIAEVRCTDGATTAVLGAVGLLGRAADAPLRAAG